jgi:hypothetical protein
MLIMARRPIVLAALLQLLAVVLQWWLVDWNLGLVEVDTATAASWICVAIIALGSTALAYLVFSSTTTSSREAATLVVVGGVFASFAAIGTVAHDDLPAAIGAWVSAPALPVWQGFLTAMLGALALWSTRRKQVT